MYLLPYAILHDVIFPALSSLQCFSPRHKSSNETVANIFMLAPEMRLTYETVMVSFQGLVHNRIVIPQKEAGQLP